MTSARTRPGSPVADLDWDELRYFLALARAGSVRTAGAALAVSHTTVARRVEALEARLGARLFDRHRDGYALTDAGRRLVTAAERVEGEVHALARGVTGEDARLAGPVHVTCGDEFMADLLLDSLADWCAANPGVQLAISRDGRPYNLAKGEADLAVRVLAPDAAPPGYLVGHRLGPLVCASYVAVAHAARLAPPAPAARWLGYTDTRVTRELVATSSYPDLPVWGAFNALSIMVRAAVQGWGLAILPTYVGDAEPRLRRLDPADVRHVGAIWLLSHPDLRQTARVQAARTAIRDRWPDAPEVPGAPPHPSG